mmetsp:Transcript_50293/g.145843  ORF Transcript_50293/g.145843 Transcript_50293/m.145843 type:complete len:890 (-) Transcript_50293:64-2733(-)
MASKDKSYRVLLPSDVVPEHYDLTLEPDLERFTFDGVVKITCDVQVATEKVVVHAKELLISSAQFTAEGSDSPMQACEIMMKVKDMTASLGFEEVLPVGKGVLEIKFRGFLNDQMAGFYRSQYTDSKGAKKHLATTQFEAIDARRCFPCWDEPARKAVFVVTLVYPAELMALSNMPPSSAEVQADGRRKETFMPTPKMSTYLLAFCIGEFEFIGGQTNAGTLARVFACPGNISKCHYALKCTIRALDFYNEFFGIPYPLPKVDMIAIPDFAAGAMENWGLVTYREVALLCDEKTVSATQKQRICTVITHELAHQWFGNLVTMEWWDDLWLNEGFANWMQTFAADKLHPEWQVWESYVGSEQQRALQLDALRSSHPIQVPIKNAEEVEEVFDAISYCKGGSVVRMIYAVLGEDKFQEGLRLYFQRHKFGNTETTDLWNAWSEASGKAIDKMMSSWTQQMGFPVLKVLTDPLEGEGSAEMEVEQSWFLADGSCEPGDETKAWMAPVLVGSDKGQAPVVFMEPPTKKQKLSCGGCSQGASWLKLNFGQHVPVRVLYPPSMLTRLARSVQSLPAEDRIGLLADSYALCKAGSLEPMQLVNLLQGFRSELNDKVWSELQAVLGGLDRVVRQGLSPETSSAFIDFAAKLVSPAFAQVGWDGTDSDDDNKKKLRSALVASLARYCFRDPAVVQEAMQRFRAFLAAPNDTSVLSADIRPAVLSIAVQSEGSEAMFDQIMAAHDAVTDGAVRIHIYSALGNAASPELKKRVLQWSLSGSVRSQDFIYIPSSMVMAGKEGAEAVFTWIREAYDQIYALLGKTSMMLFQNIVRISGAGFVTSERAAEVEAFWKGKDVYSMVAKALNQTVEGISSNAKFVERLRSSEASAPTSWQHVDSKL